MYLCRTTSFGRVSYFMCETMPRIVGPQRFINESTTRLLEVKEINETDARAGLTWLGECWGGVEACQ